MFEMVRKAKKNQKGFTLVELMVVVVIIGVLVAIAIPIYSNLTQNAKDKAYDANERILKGAAAMWIAENDLPAVDTVITSVSGELDPYIESWPENPKAAVAGTLITSVTVTTAGVITVQP